ncbi:MAG TPA: 7-cyano-7-deazaguanine synthase QueC [Xanthobacteraceae bacterium]
MGTSLNPRNALVSFSGGQDSTTVLAWALHHYERVETVGFRYGQKHFVEMHQRPIIRNALVEAVPDWKARLGPDHVVELDLIGQIAGQNILSPPSHRLIAGEGFEAGRRYIPGRNLIMLSMCASVAFRRDIRTLACGASETEYSGYPDCRSESMNAIEKAISLSSGLDFKIECPLMWLDKAGVWALANSLGGRQLVEIIRKDTHTCYSGSRDHLHEWGYGCGTCDACRLRAKGWRDFCSPQSAP